MGTVMDIGALPTRASRTPRVARAGCANGESIGFKDVSDTRSGRKFPTRSRPSAGKYTRLQHYEIA